ncbi:methyltransferase domain-containing protein [Pseudofrankia inefficax]|uniref:Protein-L-isoaspartate(D-aspartate) O-methyltransferase n=1 Tax=Pseudofrankia inefficax (strain DSM 45817 / CECT 9037 / DDB 130130 / EuI1c) TaxID=298654 RepID=E3J661_PSEI1|nr:methyltransferase domain-containing protein [Pseudofrankia inefficax]ADP78352.1 protein-L-isoaspartate(D-aspartate) O-methyltransferase [Pseudofrankia inefficax]
MIAVAASDDEWPALARDLADKVTHPGSRWHPVIASIPRHAFVPAWWARSDGGWQLRRGPLAEVYVNQTLVTRVGPHHANHGYPPGGPPVGRSTSSSTLPGLLLTMYRDAQLAEGLDIADVGTGSGYGAALLATRYGASHVTTMDVDPYLVEAAAVALDAGGLAPAAQVVDATGPLPGTYDRIVSTVSVRSIPPSWLAALRPGGRLVTSITGTWLVLTAWRTADGEIWGKVARHWAGFMPTRSGGDYPPEWADFADLATRDGDEVGAGRYPVLDIDDAWELSTMLALAAGVDVEHQYLPPGPDGAHTALMAHPDGSWARATAIGTEAPLVHQGGPRRLWDLLDGVRDDWLRMGMAPWLGAHALVRPDGAVVLAMGSWRATIPATP